ncbi:restriction endonuclease subunit S [Streptomyces olivaceus]|uniref:restriction endonuclease subunit S n=1 Tax=Streptomyces olivaceus TaxID=47716 RepID=UPI0033A7A5A8
MIQQHFRPLDELADVSGGVALGGVDPGASGTELPYLRVANVQDGYISTDDVKKVRVPSASVERFRLRAGDVLLTEGGDFDKLGRGGVWDGRIDPCLHQNHVFRVRCDTADLVPEFLSLYMASRDGRSFFLRIAKQTTNLATISSSQLKSMPIPVLPVAVQRWIVEVLASWAELERRTEASIAKLRNVRQGVLLASMESVASKEPVSGWARVPLKNIVPSAEYGISESLDRDARGVPVLRMNNIRSARIDADDLRYCPVPVPSRLFLRCGDVLFNRTNSMEHIGKAAMWRDELPSATFASYLVRLVPDLNRVTPEYLVEWLMHPLVRQRVRSISTVAVQQVNVNPSRLRELEIDLPVDLAEQRRIVATLEACDEQIGREEEELNKLRELKQGLVDDLLSARVTASGVAA